jgi:DNA polymerase III subunit gamma/tau
VSPRLTVETMLLRWAMMDRTVDLEQVLEAGQRGSRPVSPAPAKTAAESAPASAPSTQPNRGPAATSTPVPAPRSPAAQLSSVSLDAISAAWPAMVMAVRTQSRFLGEAFAATEPSQLDLPWLTVLMREPNQLFAERLLEEAGKVEEVLSRSLGQPIRLRVTTPNGEGSTPTKPRRMSESSIKAERLREFRAKDPTLDTAADALDLEIVD